MTCSHRLKKKKNYLNLQMYKGKTNLFFALEIYSALLTKLSFPVLFLIIVFWKRCMSYTASVIKSKSLLIFFLFNDNHLMQKKEKPANSEFQHILL